MVAFKCCRLPTYSPKMPHKCLKFPPNPGVSRPWLLLSAVGCQPTAPKCNQVPSNPGVSRCLKFPPKCIKYPCVSRPMVKTMVAFNLQPQNASSSLQPWCFKTPWLLLSAVGCQPTAPKCLKFPPTLVFQDPMVAFKCCRLPTYSPKMHQVPSNPGVSRPHGCF